MNPKVTIDNTIPTYKMIKRSWKERLLSWPWRPWVAKVRTNVLLVYQYKSGKMAMNKITYQYLMDKKRSIDFTKEWDNGKDSSSPSKYNV